MDNRKLDAEYFWNDNCTYDEATEAAKRWNAHNELVASLAGIMAIPIPVSHLETLNEEQVQTIQDAQKLLNSLKPI